MPVFESHNRIPQFTRYLEIIFIILILLYFGKSLFVPLLFGLLIAFISYPICKWLERRRFPRSIAIAFVMLLLIILFSILISILGYELNVFLRDIPLVADKLNAYSPGIQTWIENHLGIDSASQSDWLEKIILDIRNGLSGTLKSIFTATISTLFMLVIIPIYASLFLYHRGVFVKFLESIVGESYRDRMHNILWESIQTYSQFVKGTFFVYLIVGALNSAGLLMLGIRHAILYGMLTAFMTIIPYIGIIISASMPVAIALITKNSLWYPVGVILIFTLVQYLEANVIFPRVVGVQLNLSTWATLIAIFAGTILWGVAGMILFIPSLGILKIISDQVDDFKSINILLNRHEGYKSSRS
ncbi:MAG: AI-2E family transporter [Chitinophagales bacterium]